MATTALQVRYQIAHWYHKQCG